MFYFMGPSFALKPKHTASFMGFMPPPFQMNPGFSIGATYAACSFLEGKTANMELFRLRPTLSQGFGMPRGTEPPRPRRSFDRCAQRVLRVWSSGSSQEAIVLSRWLLGYGLRCSPCPSTFKWVLQDVCVCVCVFLENGYCRACTGAVQVTHRKPHCGF